MANEQKQNMKRSLHHGNWIWQSLGLLVLAGIVPAGVRAQSANRVVAPQAHPWAANATAKTETKVSGTVQQISSQHGISQMHIDGANGSVTADLGSAAGNAAKSFSPGDRVEISGWMHTANGRNVLIAREITAGERQIVIRNKSGILVHSATEKSHASKSVAAGTTGGAL